MATRKTGRRVQSAVRRKASGKVRRGAPSPPARGQGKREALSAADRRKLVRLGTCCGIFVLIVAVKLLLPGKLARVDETLTGLMERSIDVEAVFSAAGRAVSGETDVSIALQDMYQAVFRPQEGAPAVEASASAGGQEVDPGVPEAIAPLRAFRAGTGSGDGWLPAPSVSSAGGGDGPAPDDPAEDGAGAVTETAVEGGAGASGGEGASALAYVLYSAENLPADVCLEQSVLGFDYCTPVSGTLTSPFGYREHPVEGEERFHYGLDIGAAEGTDIVCFADGTVTAVGESSSYGKYVTISHDGGFSTLYAHCSEITAASGEAVGEGDVIARVGQTGMATGPHLHFELHSGSRYLNPIYYVSLA